MRIDNGNGDFVIIGETVSGKTVTFMIHDEMACEGTETTG